MLPDLATVEDLTARGIDTTNEELAQTLLDSVSDAVRDAAGSPIAKTTSTITLLTEPSRRIELPVRPVHAVTSVKLDGILLADCFLRGTSLWRETPWQERGEIPHELTVTVEHGYDPVPEDVVNLICMFVAAGLASAEGGFEGHRGVQSVRLDDFSETYFGGVAELVDPTEIPDRTKAALRKRFGASGSVVMGGAR